MSEDCFDFLAVVTKGTIYMGPNWVWMIITGFLPAVFFWPVGTVIWVYSLMSCERFTLPMRLLQSFLFLLLSVFYMPGLMVAILFGGGAFSYLAFMDAQKSARFHFCGGWSELMKDSYEGAGSWMQKCLKFVFDDSRQHRHQLLMPGEMPLGVTFGDLVFYVILIIFGLTVFYPLWTVMNVLKFLPATLSWYVACGGEFVKWLAKTGGARGCLGLIGFILAQPFILAAAAVFLLFLQCQGMLAIAGSCVVYTLYKDRTLGFGWYIAALQMHDRRSHRAMLECFGNQEYVDRNTGIPSPLTSWWPCEWWADPELHNDVNNIMFM